MIRMATTMLTFILTMRTAPIAPTKQTTEPTERSILPPVRIQSSIPVARINTYAFCEIRLLTFMGSRIAPPVLHAKNAVTTIKTMIMVYFFMKSKDFALFIPFLLYFPALRICDMMISCVASLPSSSPTILPSFIT